MRRYLKSINIRSLGALTDVTLDPLSPALNIIYGRNESGKSTTRDAIRYGLFGFPGNTKATGGSVDRRYKNGLREVALEFVGVGGDDGTRFSALRQELTGKLVPGTLTITPDRELSSFESLASGVSSVNYHTMWNVSTDNMPAIDSGESGESTLGTLLAAMHGTRVSPADASKALKSDIEAMYGRANSDQGMKPKIARAIEIDTQLRAASVESEDALRALADARALDQTIDGLTQQAESARGHESRLRLAHDNLGAVLDEATASERRLSQAVQERDELTLLIARGTDPTTVALAAMAGRVREVVLARGAADSARGTATRLGSRAETLQHDIDRDYAEVPAILSAADLAAYSGAVRDLADRYADAEKRLAALGVANGDTTGTAVPAMARPLGAGTIAIAAAAAMGAALTGILAGGDAALSAVAGVAVGAIAIAMAWFFSNRMADGAAPSAGVDPRTVDAARTQLASAESALRDYLNGNELLTDLRGLPVGEVVRLMGKAQERAALERELAGVVAEENEHTCTVGAWQASVTEITTKIEREFGIQLATIDDVAARVEECQRAVRSAQDASDRTAAVNARIAGEADVLTKLSGWVVSAAAAIDRSAPAPASLTETISAAHELEPLIAIGLDAATERMRTIEAELKASVAERASKEQIYALATKSDLIESLRSEREQLVGEIEAIAEAYAVHAAALALIARAEGEYGGTSSPEILERASEIMGRMTSGEWTAIETSTGDVGGSLRAVHRDGRSVAPDAMSSGTVAALYLSVRLGALLALPDTGTSLPILLDDVLVHFDGPSTDGAINALCEVARSRQIIYFTCSLETAKALEDKANQVGISPARIELADRRSIR